MKLYSATGACSLASNIALREAGLPFDLVKVDLRSKKTATGEDFNQINPKGYVPALQLDNGEVLTEGAAVLQYIADLKPESKLAPKFGTMERYRLMEWLTFINSEVHKTYSVLFNPASPEEVKTAARERIISRLKWVGETLGKKPYLMGDTFTVADAYLYTVLTWSKGTGVDLTPLTVITDYVDRVFARPAVQAARASDK